MTAQPAQSNTLRMKLQGINALCLAWKRVSCEILLCYAAGPQMKGHPVVKRLLSGVKRPTLGSGEGQDGAVLPSNNQTGINEKITVYK